MYIHVYSINPYISCHKQNRVATLEGRSALLFSLCWIISFYCFCESLREPYSLYSRHPNPQVCLLCVSCLLRFVLSFVLQATTFHSCRHASLPYFYSYGHCVVASLAFSDIECCFLNFTPFTQFSALFATSYFGRSRHTYFFRRKVSASRIVSTTSTLLPELFQKLFAVCSQPTKTFLLPRWNNSGIPCLPAFLANSDSNVKNKCFTSKPLFSIFAKYQIKENQNKLILSYFTSILCKLFLCFDIFDFYKIDLLFYPNICDYFVTQFKYFCYLCNVIRDNIDLFQLNMV